MALSKSARGCAVLLFLATTTPGLPACSKKMGADSEDLNREAPAPAPPAPGLATYAWKADGLATFQLKTKGMLLRGSVGGVRGQLTVDAGDLSRSKATLSLDLSTLRVGSTGEGGSPDQYSKEARAWFGLGDAKTPASNGEALRTASFRLTALTQLSATAPRDGARLGRSQTGTEREKHRVRAVAEGELLLHGFRVRQAVPITLDFTYGAPSGDRYPESLQVTSRSPFPLSLLAHDILPRTESGVVVSEKMREFGKTMGSEALVEFDFQATRISR